jgi:hypothetical protein
VLAACAALSVALAIAFTLLLAAALTFPDDARIEANLRDAAQSGVLSRLSYPRSAFGDIEHRYDMYTDCVAFGMNLSNREEGLLRRMAASRTAAFEAGNLGPCGRLVDGLQAQDLRARFDYPRFWHGYQVYFRPLLAIAPLDAVRRLTALLFCASMAFFAAQLARMLGPWAWPLALLPFFLIGDFFTVASVGTHALSLICAFLPAALIPLIIERWPRAQEMALPLFVFAMGAVSNFLNFLINPPLAPALIAFMYLAVTLKGDARQAPRAALYAASLALLWFSGYGAAWIQKWLLAAAVLGPDAILAELNKAMGDYDATRVRMHLGLLSASRHQLSWIMAGYTALAGLVALALVWRVTRTSPNRVALWIDFAWMLAPLAVVVLWVEANSAHSAQHAGFVHRSYLLFSVLPSLAALKLWRDARRSPVSQTTPVASA